MRSFRMAIPASAADSALLKFGVQVPTWSMMFLALLATELLPLPIDYLAGLIMPNEAMGGPDIGSRGLTSDLVVGCLIAPVAETAFNQWGCITLLRKKLGARSWTATVASAALFASLHWYSWKYMMTTFPIGLVLGYVFVVETIRDGRAFRAFWIVALIHSVRNAISIAFIH